jgi:hypothetical protein
MLLLKPLSPPHHGLKKEEVSAYVRVLMLDAGCLAS